MLKAFLIAALASGAAPAAPSAPFVANGVGTAPCELFNSISSRDPKWAKDNFVSWAQGFMAGSNVERGDQKRPRAIVNTMDEDAIWAKLTSYCQSNPNKPFLMGLMVIYMSLPTVPEGR
jgi:hypothetical protein